jgi:hypothetical protein
MEVKMPEKLIKLMTAGKVEGVDILKRSSLPSERPRSVRHRRAV